MIVFVYFNQIFFLKIPEAMLDVEFFQFDLIVLILRILVLASYLRLALFAILHYMSHYWKHHQHLN